MNRNRTIRLTAAAVICCGAVGLGVLTPPAALATSCPGKTVCVAYNTCMGWSQATRLSVCNTAAPGCTASSAFCDPILPPCGSGGLVCTYQ